MAGIAGLRGTGNWGTDERPKSFRETILFMNPNGTAPIFGLTAKARKKTVKDPEFNWWAETMTTVRLQVNGALGSGDTVVTVDSPDPTSSTMYRNYGMASHLKAGDVLLVVPSADAATYDNELIEVVSVQSDTQFVAQRGVAGTTAASIANDAYLLLVGNAYAEGTGAPDAVSRNPVKFSNYTQIFKDAYELTNTADVTETRTGNTWSNDKKRKMFDHARAIEFSIIWGRKFETTGANGKPKRYMGGLREQIPQATPANGGRTTVFGAAVTVSSFLDAVSPVFDFDMGGGDTRVMMAGNQAILELNKVFQNATNAKMELGSVIKLYGLDAREFILPRGRLLLVSHPLLSQDALYKKSAFILDFSALTYITLPGRDTKTFDDVQNKDEDIRRGYVQTECSLALEGGGLSCAYLGNISAT